jgi:hypothetical protein
MIFQDQKIAAFGSSDPAIFSAINDPETLYGTHYRRLLLSAPQAPGC